MLAGLISPTAGSATVNGHSLGEGSQRIRAITGILTESPGLHEKLTARQNLAFYGRLYGLRGARLREAVERYLGVVEMSEHADRRVADLQQGDAPEGRHRASPAPRAGGDLPRRADQRARPLRREDGARLRGHAPRPRPLDRGLHPQPRRGGAALRPDRDHARHAAAGRHPGRPPAPRAGRRRCGSS